MIPRRFVYTTLSVLFCAITLSPQLARAATSPDKLWRTVDRVPAAKAGAISAIRPNKFQAFTADLGALRTTLTKAPAEFSATRSPLGRAEITLPKPDGTFARFYVEEAALMEPELAAKFPEIKTYRGRGIDDPAASLHLDVNAKTFHAQVLSPSGAYYVDPYWHLDGSLFMSYTKSDLDDAADRFKCSVLGEKLSRQPVTDALDAPNASGTTLRTYRFACSTSIQYSRYHSSDPNNPTVPEIMAAVATMNNRVSGLYEVEFGNRFVLVANNELIVSTNSNPGPFTDTPGDADSNGPWTDQKIGAANYDIGHVVTVGSGGAAYLGVICKGSTIIKPYSQKAGGTTGYNPPVGDPFWVDYVAHEVGHQFGGNHTFNGTGANCGAANQNPNTAYEPGSGSTIQAYAGICGAANNLQRNSDPYWHFISLEEMLNHSTSNTGGGSCPVKTNTGNLPPTVEAGPDFKMPARTPFTLTAVNGADPNGDPITYCWEEADLGPEKAGNAPDNGRSPLFRSFSPTTSPTRTFPRMQYVLNNGNNPPASYPCGTSTCIPGETLPTTTRELKFRVTVRDNRWGGWRTDLMKIDVIDSGAGFEVTAPNGTGTTYDGGSTQTVTWNVANSATAPINTTHVNILFSNNGGNNFNTVLVANTPNDGSETVTIPYGNNTTSRIKVEAVGNIFFDVSNANFAIVSVDTDGDGIPDGFETSNGLDPSNPADGGEDLDGDGASNFHEYVAGTNLNDPNSLLKIVNIVRNAANAAVSFTTAPGRRYQLETKADMLDAAWAPVSGETFGTGNVETLNDPEGGSTTTPAGRRFYRARVFH